MPALPQYFHACKHVCLNLNQICIITPSSGRRKKGLQEVTIIRAERPPADQFASLQSGFRRRLLLGLGTASVVALGADFLGVTSFLLGLAPESSRSLKLDVVYPIGGYSRCIDTNEGFEFIYPASWVGDQTLLYRAAEKKEFERSLDPPPLNFNTKSRTDARRRNVSEPVVAFGPPATTGELNVSVIVSPVALDFKIEAFGGPKEVGEAVVRTVTGSGKRPDIKGTLIESKLREDSASNVKYYELEFRVESPLFHQQNIAVCCFCGGRLFTQCSGTGISMAGGEVRPAILVRIQQFSGRQSHSYRRKV